MFAVITRAILNRLAPSGEGEAIYGDIAEEYKEMKQEYSSCKSFLIITSLIISTITTLISMKIKWSTSMIINYLRTAVRVLLKQKFYTSINILCLSLGISLSAIIFLWIQTETQYDRFNTNHERIFRLVAGNYASSDSFATTPAPLADSILSSTPEIEQVVRITRQSGTFKTGNKSWKEAEAFYTDHSFRDIFTIDIVKGSYMKGNSSILISESSANRFFGKSEAIGETVVFNGRNYQINGVFRDFPQASHMHPAIILPFKSHRSYKYNRESWGAWNYKTYVMLRKGAAPDKIRISSEEIRRDDLTISLQPLTNIHLQYNRSNFEAATESKHLVVLGTAAFIILILASINYVNLSTAMLLKRGEEIGIRKVIGARRGHLISQIYGETAIITFAAGILGIAILNIIKPFAENLAGKELPSLLDPSLIIIYPAALLLTTLITGIYPAYNIYSPSISELIRSKGKLKSSATLRKVMLIIQFSILSILICSSYVISSQLSFMKNFDIGMNSNNVINIPLKTDNSVQKRWVLKNQIKSLPGVASVSFNSYEISNINWNQNFFFTNQQPDQNDSAWIIIADKDFCRTMGIDILKSTDKTAQYEDTVDEAWIMNRSAFDLTGWKNTEGKKLTIFGNSEKAPILGVTENFNFRSLKHTIAPCLLFISDRRAGAYPKLTVKLSPGTNKQTIASIESIWKKLSGTEAFEFNYFKENMERIYKFEKSTESLLGIFTLISIIIAVSGLFTLSSYIIEKKLKEIVIRKVLGADTEKLALSLSRDFLLLILISFAISWPASYIFTSGWLKEFTFKTSLTTTPYIVSALICTTIAIATIGFHVYRAAASNPAEILSKE